MMSFFKKISPYTTGLFFPLFAQFVFAGARQGVLVFIAAGSLLLQLLVNAAVETSGRKKGMPDVKRHLVKLSFAILFNSVLLSVHGFFDLSDTAARRRFFIFVVVGISLLIKDFLILKKPVFEKQSEEGKSGLAQYVKFVMYLVLGLALVVLINIAVIRFGPPKAPYFWANQIKESSELEDFDGGVILFGRETCPSCIEVERILRGLPKKSDKYYITSIQIVFARMTHFRRSFKNIKWNLCQHWS